MKKKEMIIVAVFDSENNNNRLAFGEGFTIVEAIVRAVSHSDIPDELQELIHTYGPDDIGGLMEFYEDRGIYASEPQSNSDMKEFLS